jgi:hypothetical protein
MEQNELSTVIHNLFDAFNRRAVDEALSFMHPTVHWPIGWDGGYIDGHDAVRDYWSKQWTEYDRHAIPLQLVWLNDNRVKVLVRQRIKDRAGNLLWEGNVIHTYTFGHQLVTTMEPQVHADADGVLPIPDAAGLPSMQQPFIITTRISWIEYTFLSTVAGLKTSLLAYIGIFAGGYWLWDSVVVLRRNPANSQREFVVNCLIAVICIFLVPIRNFFVYLKYPMLRGPIEYAFYPDRITVRSKDKIGDIKWREVTKLVPGGRLLFLRKGGSSKLYMADTRGLNADQKNTVLGDFQRSRRQP